MPVAFCSEILCLFIYVYFVVMWYFLDESMVYVRPQRRTAIFTSWLCWRVLCPDWVEHIFGTSCSNKCLSILVRFCEVCAGWFQLQQVSGWLCWQTGPMPVSVSFQKVAGSFMSWIGRAIHFLEMTFIGFAAMCLARISGSRWHGLMGGCFRKNGGNPISHPK